MLFAACVLLCALAMIVGLLALRRIRLFDRIASAAKQVDAQPIAALTDVPDAYIVLGPPEEGSQDWADRPLWLLEAGAPRAVTSDEVWSLRRSRPVAWWAHFGDPNGKQTLFAIARAHPAVHPAVMAGYRVEQTMYALLAVGLVIVLAVVVALLGWRIEIPSWGSQVVGRDWRGI
jgi:hypothetical protein